MEPTDRPIQRAEEARRLLETPILRDALEAVRSWAMSSLTAAKTRDEAWDARQRIEAVEVFAAYLRAVLTHGKANVEAMQEADRKRRFHKPTPEREFLERVAAGGR
jgi:hypothetical protein